MKFTLEERPSDSPFVERVWRAYSGPTGTFLSQAKSCWQIVVTRHEGQTLLTVRGPETEATPMDVQWTEGEFVGIDFQLGTFLPHLPPGQVMNLRDANLPEATSTSFWLCGSAWSYPNYDNADTFVNRLVRSELLVRDPIVEAVLHGLPHQMSPRSVQYRFVQATGLSYRTIQQIERARQAAALLEQGWSIPDVVYQAGYFDQPHLTHALQRFLGETPAQIARSSQPE
ncbi:MAG TPA: helix-turn-helix domain-containing protein [Ktedonobacteraceae bacterium]|nr:helix-turn-helix domain-containing protein [Ktedonobacteraceae bacterium]